MSCNILVFSLLLISWAKPRVLVFTKTTGYNHASIKNGVDAINKLGVEHQFVVDTTSDAGKIEKQNLRKYAAVIFLSTTGDLLDSFQKNDFRQYIEKGGGWVGIHAATDAEYDWPWYGQLAGGYFNGHPAQQQATIEVVDTTDESTRFLPRFWTRTDEWYNFKDLSPDIHVLLVIRESSYHGGTNGAMHPMAWKHSFDGGRAWYTELGHTEESWTDPLYLKHVLGGIRYAMGENKK